MLSEKDVKHIASLARIELTEQEVLRFQEELASVLEYFEILAEVDVSQVEPMTHSVRMQNIYRKDAAKPQDVKAAEKLVKAAPKQQKGYVQVKPIL